MPSACRFVGHEVRFWPDGSTMRWECERECGMKGEKTYPTAAEARRYAAAFDRSERDDLGRRAPLSLLPLRLIRRAKRT